MFMWLILDKLKEHLFSKREMISVGKITNGGGDSNL